MEHLSGWKEADRHDRTAEAIEKLGGQNGSVDGSHIKQLESGDWMIWHDNSFETLQMEDIETLAGQEGIAEYNITTANIVVNPMNFVHIEDPGVDQHSDLLGMCLRGNMEMRLDFDCRTVERAIADLVQAGLLTKEQHWREHSMMISYPS